MSHTTIAEAPPTVEEGWSGQRVAVIIILIAMISAGGMLLSVGSQAIPSVQKEFNTSLGFLSPTLLLLSGAIFNPIFGRLADIHGKRRIIVIGVVIGAVGAVISALAPDYEIFLVGRVVQGALTAVIFIPTALVRETFPSRIVPSAIGIVLTGAGLPGAFLPFVTGWLLDSYGVTVLFLAIGGYALVTALVVRVFLQETTVRATGRLDILGSFLLGFALAAILAGVSLSSTLGWGSPLIFGLLAIGVVFAIAWVVTARRIKQPLIDVRVIARRSVWSSLIVGGLSAAVSAAFLITASIVSQTPSKIGLGYGLSLNASGFAILEGGLLFGLLVGGFIAGQLVRKLGEFPLLGLTLTVGVAASLLTLLAINSLPVFALLSFVIGLVSGIMFATLLNLLLRIVPDERKGSTSTVWGTTVSVFQSLIPVVAISLAAAIAPGIAGGLSKGGVDVLFVACAICFAAAIVVLLLARPGRAEGSPTEIPAL